MPNAVAYLALFGWPIVAIILFSRLKFERAIIWSLTGSFFFLPTGFGIDLPGLPPMDKVSLPNLALLMLAAIYAKKRFRLLPVSIGAKLLLILLIAGAFMTVVTNQDPIFIADTVLPGTTMNDALSNIVRTALWIIPFLIGWQYLSSAEAHRDLLKVLFAIGIVYSLLMLYEIRMSPQLHTMVYGYFPHSFAQQFRQGGFRPVVFLQHGLWVAFFAMTIAVAAAALWRHSFTKDADTEALRMRAIYIYTIPYFAVILVLCKSLGSLMLGIIAVPLVLFTSPKVQIRVAAVLVMIAMTYPMLRGAQLVPVDSILSFARSIDPQRAESFATRIENEDRLLVHAEARPVFGWGSWGRNRVYDPETGIDITIVDGFWVGQISATGWAGYIAVFGLLAFPVIMLWLRTRPSGADPPPPTTAALALLIGINMIELLPNSTFLSTTWLMAGAVLGYAMQKKPVITEETRAIEKPDTPAARTGRRTVL